MTVTFVNLFEVDPARDEEFFALWREVDDYMTKQPGYVNHTMHRALDGRSLYRYINVAVWETEELHRDAHDDGFRALVANPDWKPFPHTPGLFEVVHSGHA